jgi:hypothetical protein
MSTLLTARQICDRALRKIGAFPITESAARGEDVDEALFWLDLIVAELPGTVRRYWLLSDTLYLSLTPGDLEYDLATTVTDWPAQGVEHVTEIWLENSTGSRTPVKIVDRNTFEERSLISTPGSPEIVHIDRMVKPTLRPWPVIASTGYRLALVAEMLGPDIAPKEVSPKNDRAAVEHGLPQAWQMWLINQLACEIGDGPVRKLASTTIGGWRSQNERKKTDLESFQDTEKQTTDPITQSMDIC